MTAAARSSAVNPTDRTFFLSLVALALLLLLAGASGWWYLSANSPLSLLSGSDRPIAAATAFVPARSPFTFSLLARPEELVALQQAITSPDRRQQTRAEIEQIMQGLLSPTGLDLGRDIQPWAGSETTFAFTEPDLDLDDTNGQQPGYLLAIEIEPGREAQAQAFLQLLWQRQSLAGREPQFERISGTRALYSPGTPTLTAATALVGNQLVLLANDIRVLRRSLRAAQAATNLAQSRAYRQAVAQLPEQRIALAYMNAAFLSGVENLSSPNRRSTPPSSPTFAAIGIGVTRTGLVADVRLAPRGSPGQLQRNASPSAPQASLQSSLASAPVGALKFLPANSEIALGSHNLNQLKEVFADLGIPSSTLPEFLDFSDDRWRWATAEYAIGQVNTGGARDWILAVARDEAGIARVDDAALARGYQPLPVSVQASGNLDSADGSNSADSFDSADSSDIKSERAASATAWTRLRAGGKSGGAIARRLETEILGFHLQQGGYEIFASSLAALNSAIAAPQNSLCDSARFRQAIAPLSEPNRGYLYLDWPAIAPAIDRAGPIGLTGAAKPALARIDTLAATWESDAASLFLQLTGRTRVMPRAVR